MSGYKLELWHFDCCLPGCSFLFLIGHLGVYSVKCSMSMWGVKGYLGLFGDPFLI